MTLLSRRHNHSLGSRSVWRPHCAFLISGED